MRFLMNVLLSAMLCFAGQSYAQTSASTEAISSNDRIINGEVTKPFEFPWLVSLQSSRHQHFCGGSLIAPNWVLTAAHCVHDIKPSFVETHRWDFDRSQSSESAEMMAVDQSKIYAHNGYDPSNTMNDVALIYFPTSFHTDPVQLINATETSRVGVVGEMATVAGWGNVKATGTAAYPRRMNKVSVPIVTNDVCQQGYKSQGAASTIFPSNICAGYAAGGKDACQGDSGGPLFVQTQSEPERYAQIGVVSWGIGCASPNYYGVYSRVSSFLPWIQNVMTQVEHGQDPNAGQKTNASDDSNSNDQNDEVDWNDNNQETNSH